MKIPGLSGDFFWRYRALFHNAQNSMVTGMNKQDIEKLIRPEIRALSAYHVPDAAGFIKLDAMENPYHWPDAMLREWLDVIRRVELNRYPDPAAAELAKQLRANMKVPNGNNILLGNGSDELIQMIMMAGNQGQRESGIRVSSYILHLSFCMHNGSGEGRAIAEYHGKWL